MSEWSFNFDFYSMDCNKKTFLIFIRSLFILINQLSNKVRGIKKINCLIICLLSRPLRSYEVLICMCNVCDMYFHLILHPYRYCAQQNIQKGIYSFVLWLMNIDCNMSAALTFSYIDNASRYNLRVIQKL